MGEESTIVPELVMPELGATDPRDAINQLGSLLVNAGFATESYVEGVLERERNYPTGIEFPLCGVAMPHGEPDGVLGAAIAVGRCSEPIRFRRMEDFSQDVEVRIVVMLAVSDPAGHLDVLGKLIGVFSDEETCRQILSAKDSSAIVSVLGSAINGGEQS